MKYSGENCNSAVKNDQVDAEGFNIGCNTICSPSFFFFFQGINMSYPVGKI